MTTNTAQPTTKSRNSIADLRIYQLALSLEEQVFQMVKDLPPKQFDLGNDLRRASAGVAHYIYDAHRRYNYTSKVDSLHAARTEAEQVNRLLDQFEKAGFAQTKSLVEDYTTLIKQSWGLIKWLKTRQTEKDQTAQVQATDQLVKARS